MKKMLILGLLFLCLLPLVSASVRKTATGVTTGGVVAPIELRENVDKYTYYYLTQYGEDKSFGIDIRTSIIPLKRIDISFSDEVKGKYLVAGLPKNTSIIDIPNDAVEIFLINSDIESGSIDSIQLTYECGECENSVLRKLVGNTWQDLETENLGEGFYKAEMDDFSYFAVVDAEQEYVPKIKSEADVEINVLEPDEGITELDETEEGTSMFAKILVIVCIIIGAVLAYKMVKSKGKKDE